MPQVNILTKKSVVYQSFDKAVAIACNFTKNIRPFWKSNNNSDVSKEKLPWWKLLSSKIAGVESTNTILLKLDFITEINWQGFCVVTPFLF